MNYKTGHISILFELLKSSLFNREVNSNLFADLNKEDWKVVKCISEKQGVSAITFDALDRLKLEGIQINMLMDDLMDWLGQTSYIESAYIRHMEDSNLLANLWKKNSIYTMVFKGLALSRYYPVPAHREFGDFDCYLFGKFDEGNRIAENAGGKVDTGWYKHSQISFKGIMAENHKYFTQCRKGKKERALNLELVNSLHDGSFLESIDGTNMLLPPLSFEGLFLTYHAMGHFLSEGLSIRHICDWACWMNANQNRISWNSFYSQCKHYGYDRFVDAMNAISVEYLGLVITNQDIKIDNTYSERILENTLYEDSKIYNKGGKWYSRYGVIRNAFRYSWKYREIAQYSMMKYIWSYIGGFICRNEDD